MARRRKDDEGPKRPAVTRADVERDRQAGYLSRAWVLPAAPVSDDEPDAVVQTEQPLPTIGVVPRLVLEIAPGNVVPPRPARGRGATRPDRARATRRSCSTTRGSRCRASTPRCGRRVTAAWLSRTSVRRTAPWSCARPGAQEPSVGGAQVIARPGDVVMVGDYAVRVLAG
ncbi:hypothetical protein Q9Q99_11110 [Curtobacterium flaccumfaciens]|nr:hypothetical protein Q9Q99_11110 [Curtobacterium flaccumfaciens]